jgi:hypothetical protein
VVVIFGFKKIFTSLKPFFSSFVSSVYVTKESAINKSTSAFETKSSLQNKVINLENKISDYEKKEAEGLIQNIEIQDLRLALGVIETSINTFMVKRVTPISVYGTFGVSSSVNTIKVGDSVLSKNGYYIGQVVETQGSSATVLSAEKSKSSLSLLLPQSEISVEATGGNRSVLVSKIPRDVNVEVGEVVVLASATNIPVGTVVSLSEDEKSPLKEIYIRMAGQVEKNTIFLIKSN